MSFTFGGATGDDANWNGGSAGATATVFAHAGWFYPTTLTAGRTLFSVGNNCRAEIDTTTDELRLRTDNTTDGQWTTSGVDLAVDSWKFIACLLTCNNTGPAAAWRVWAGDIVTPPIECTVTVATSPNGNFTGSSTHYAGNAGTGTVAFQGEIGAIVTRAATVGGGAQTNQFQIGNAGTITNDEAEFAFRRFVLPAWLGDTSFNGLQLVCPANQSSDGRIIRFDAALNLAVIAMQVGAVAEPYRAMTINGATVSAMREPRPVTPMPHLYAAVRR